MILVNIKNKCFSFNIHVLQLIFYTISPHLLKYIYIYINKSSKSDDYKWRVSL